MNLGNEHATADDEHARLYGQQHERPALYCIGPGHRFEWDAEHTWLEQIEPCPVCVGLVRNHWGHRYPEGIDLL